MGTSTKRSSNIEELYTLGSSYSMSSYPVDGMDVEEVYKSVLKAAKRSRKGEGPTLLELRTYRYRGHSMSDPATYRTREEVSEYRKKDPIEKVKQIILDRNFASEEQMKEIDSRIKNIVQESVSYAEKSDYPSDEESLSDVYKQDNYPFIID